MKVITVVFTKKCRSGQMGHFGPKNGAYPQKFESTRKFF